MVGYISLEHELVLLPLINIAYITCCFILQSHFESRLSCSLFIPWSSWPANKNLFRQKKQIQIKGYRNSLWKSMYQEELNNIPFSTYTGHKSIIQSMYLACLKI